MIQTLLLNIFDFAFDIVDAATALLAQSYFLQKRKLHKATYFLLSISLAILLFICNNYIPGMTGVILYKTVEVSFLVYSFGDTPRYKRFLSPIITSLLQIASDAITFGTLIFFNPTVDLYSMFYKGIFPLYIGMVMLSRLFFVTSSFFTITLIKQKTTAENYWFVVIPALSFITGLLLISQLLLGKLNGIIYLVVTVLILLMNVISFYLLNITAKATQALAKEQSTKTIEGLKEEQYKRLMETNEETRKWKHDIKNHIYTSIGFLQEGHPKDAETYLTNLVGSIQTSTFAIQSGNAILDAVLSTKISECIKKDITVHLDISIPDKYMKSIDVCSIIGNLMDNAINACELLPNDNRDIWIRLKPTKTFITLTVKNPIPPKEAELARKERQKGELHGIGLKQIKKRVASYNGIYLQTIENNLWVANVSIPLETDVIWLKTYCGTFGGVIRMAQTYEKVAKKYATTLVNRKIISPQEKNLHIYGMILLLNNSVICILSLTIGLLIHQFLTTLLFLISFSLLRIHIGGLHAKTPLRCTIISVGICFASQIITIYSKINSIYILYAFTICFSIYLFVVTFIENKKDKIIGMVYIVVTMTSAIFLESNHKPESTTLLFAIFSVGMLKLLERVKTSYDKKEIRISKR